MPESTVNFLPSWQNAKDPSDAPPLRIMHEDGSVHFSDLKRLSGGSGRAYLHAVNFPEEPTGDMLVGTAVHRLVLGERDGHEVLRFDGDRRQGKAWDIFRAANPTADILTAPEWEKAERIAAAVLEDPVARRRLEGARYEVPLEWQEGAFRCSTRGIDILHADAIADLKVTAFVEPSAWQRHARRMHYHAQLAWYLRGARANGLDPKALYLLGVDKKAPHEVVELELTEGVLDLAERELTLWLERLSVLVSSCPEPRALRDWPGYVANTVPLELQPWEMSELDEEEDAA